MQIGRIDNATRELGKPVDWDDAKHGKCGSLAIRDQAQHGVNQMVSAWFPTLEEMRRIVCGAPVYLMVVGTVHPPVMLTVGEVPK